MDASTVLLLIAGLGFLVGGAELLVRGASRLAAALGISPLVVGLTVVAFGTSSPEVAVSVSAALEGNADIAFGNVVGSNIFNVLLILGTAAAITPVRAAPRLLRTDLPIMIAATLLMAAMALDGRVSSLEGVVLLCGLSAYVAISVRVAWEENQEAREKQVERQAQRRSRKRTPAIWNVGLTACGLVALTLGSRWFVAGAAGAARALGVDDLVIGLTLVAIGTSLPELATSVLAAARGEGDIAIGNVIGSNIFNVFAVLGASSFLAPGGVAVPEGAIRFGVPVALATALACLPILLTGRRIARWEGFLLLGYGAAYVAYLVLEAKKHEALPALESLMWVLVIPATLAALAVSAARSLLGPQGAEQPPADPPD